MVLYRTSQTAREQGQGLTPIVAYPSGSGPVTGNNQCDYTITSINYDFVEKWNENTGKTPHKCIINTEHLQLWFFDPPHRLVWNVT